LDFGEVAGEMEREPDLDFLSGDFLGDFELLFGDRDFLSGDLERERLFEDAIKPSFTSTKAT